jgi:hypothetical protein
LPNPYIMNGICVPTCNPIAYPEVYNFSYDIYECSLNNYSNSALISANPLICSNPVSNFSRDNLKVNISRLGYPRYIASGGDNEDIYLTMTIFNQRGTPSFTFKQIEPVFNPLNTSTSLFETVFNTTSSDHYQNTSN